MKYTKEQALEAFFDDYYHYKKYEAGPSTTAKELLKKEFPISSEKIINELEFSRQMIEALKGIYRLRNIILPPAADVKAEHQDEVTAVYQAIKKIELLINEIES